MTDGRRSAELTVGMVPQLCGNVYEGAKLNLGDYRLQINVVPWWKAVTPEVYGGAVYEMNIQFRQQTKNCSLSKVLLYPLKELYSCIFRWRFCLRVLQQVVRDTEGAGVTREKQTSGLPANKREAYTAHLSKVQQECAWS